LKSLSAFAAFMIASSFSFSFMLSASTIARTPPSPVVDPELYRSKDWLFPILRDGLNTNALNVIGAE